MFLPEPSLFSSPDATNFRSAPSIELMLSEGQSSRISCLVNRPTLFRVARLPFQEQEVSFPPKQIGLQSPCMPQEPFRVNI